MASILKELRDRLLILRLNRPEKANAFNLAMIGELLDIFQKAAGETQVRCILLTGTGSSFSAGHDVTEMLAAHGQDMSYSDHMKATYNPLILLMRRIEKPVLAAINGACAGAGLGIALACDIRLAAETAMFTVGFTGIGLIPDSGVSLLLPLIIGLGRASEATMTNAPIPAQKALAWGLVNRVTPAEHLEEEARRLAADLAKGPVEAFGLTKRAFNEALLPGLEPALEREAHLQEIARQGQEHRQGVAAFLKKHSGNSK